MSSVKALSDKLIHKYSLVTRGPLSQLLVTPVIVEFAAQEGKLSGGIPVVHGMKVYAPINNTSDDKGFNTIPAKFISIILIRPVEKTTMLGGVATGKANAQLQAKVIGLRHT